MRSAQSRQSIVAGPFEKREGERERRELSFPSFRLYAVYKCRAQAHTKFTIVYPREMKRVPGDYRERKKEREKGNRAAPEESREGRV